jgi:Flp pilus assembly pilin Flp
MNFRRIIQLAVDDSGQDLVEYAIASSVVAVGTVAVAFGIVATMGTRYSAAVANIQAAWEPCAPSAGVCP